MYYNVTGKTDISVQKKNHNRYIINFNARNRKIKSKTM